MPEIVWVNIFAKLKKYVLEQRLLLNKELQQRLSILQNAEKLRKVFLKKIKFWKARADVGTACPWQNFRNCCF